MDNKLNCAEIIEGLIAATYGSGATASEKRVFREALRGLVRLAKSEQMLEMKSSVHTLSGGVVPCKTMQHGNNKTQVTQLQQQFDFPHLH